MEGGQPVSNDNKPDVNAEESRRFASFGLGPIDQVSFAVPDLDEAMPIYEALFGEFTVRETAMTPDVVKYRGQPADAKLRLAFARSGDVEIELVQLTHGGGPALEHIERHGHGMQHIRFVVDDLEAKLASMLDAGFAEVLKGVSPRGSRYAYVEAPDLLGHTMIELIQQPAPN
jgi:methylmalonyl-CoA/ethylmalonyl-CoA epimerase